MDEGVTVAESPARLRPRPLRSNSGQTLVKYWSNTRRYIDRFSSSNSPLRDENRLHFARVNSTSPSGFKVGGAVCPSVDQKSCMPAIAEFAVSSAHRAYKNLRSSTAGSRHLLWSTDDRYFWRYSPQDTLEFPSFQKYITCVEVVISLHNPSVRSYWLGTHLQVNAQTATSKHARVANCRWLLPNTGVSQSLRI